MPPSQQPWSPGRPDPATAARFDKIRADTARNQQQIENLTEAHHVLRDAVSGIAATQGLLRFSKNQPTGDTMAQSAATPSRSRLPENAGSESVKVQKPRDSSAESDKRSPSHDKAEWIDDDYRESNPWYGRSKEKAVFSLGKSLPHKSRGQGRSKGESKPEPSPEGRAEEGQGGGDRGSGFQPGDKYKVDGEPVGQTEDELARKGEKDPNELRNWWARLRAKYPEPMAEFLATGMSIFLGITATLSVNLSKDQENQYGDYETASFAWGFAFMFGIYIGGGVSGAHMNPAISISLALFRGFPWRQCALYIVVQFAASMAAAALAYGVYYDAIHFVDPDLSASYTSFFSSPQEWVSDLSAFFSQFVAGAVMMIAVLALGDDSNNPPGAGLHAFILGLLVTTLKFTMGYNTGSALNPASDLGPRLVAYLVGYRTPRLFANYWWLYGPWGGALAGSIAGCTLYDAFIFVGSESPINYRIPVAFRKRTKKLFDGGEK